MRAVCKPRKTGKTLLGEDQILDPALPLTPPGLALAVQAGSAA